MAPGDTPSAHRRRRGRRTRPAALAPMPPGSRHVAGPLPSPSPSAFATHNHINIVKRPTEDVTEEGATDTSETPVHTNPSFLTETDTGLDLHQRTSRPQAPTQPASFADMARSGLGPQWRPDHMVSHEPASLANFVKFKKPRRNNRTSPFDDDANNAGTNMGGYSLPEYQQVTPNMPPFLPAQETMNPVDALQAHFQMVRLIFGRELPPPSNLQETEGLRDGEIQFTKDAGGDIVAHQWYANDYVWKNIGLYSYRRDAIEGAIGVRKLKGHKIGASLPRNKVEEFLALAKQYKEESTMAAISPTSTFDARESRARQPPPPAAIPLVSPRPLRPSASLIHSDLNGSMSTVGYGSQQTGFPTMNTFAQTGRVPILQRSMSKLSDGQASFLGPPPSASIRESNNSSPTNPQASPLSHRHAAPTTANTTFEQSKPAGYVSGLAASTIFSEAAEQAKLRQAQVWQQEQAMRAQQPPRNVEAPRHPIYGDHDITAFRATMPEHRYQPLENPFRTNLPDRAAAATNTARPGLQAAPDLAPGRAWQPSVSHRNDTPLRDPNDLSWTSLAQGRFEDPIDSYFRPQLPLHMRREQAAQAQQRETEQNSDPSEPPMAISTIGASQADENWHARPMPIFPAKGKNAEEFEDSSTEISSTIDTSFSLRPRGPFFTADRPDPYGRGIDSDLEAKVHALAQDLADDWMSNHVSLRSTLKSVTTSDGALYSEGEIEELSNDPKHLLMHRVKGTIQQYNQQPFGADYWTKGWTKPDEKYIDTSEEGRKSFFASPCLSSDEEVTFKGRSNVDSVWRDGNGEASGLSRPVNPGGNGRRV